METKILGTTSEDIREAGQIIARGGLVAFPTETVYGLGANALDPEAVAAIYEVKGRPADNPSIVHIADMDELAELTPHVSDMVKKVAAEFWPGPLTMIMERNFGVPDVTTGGLDSVGIRMPANEVARELIKEAGCPVAAPSANLSGKPSPTSAQHVLDDFDGKIDAVIDGGSSEIGIESTVVDMTGDVPMILRPGFITKEDMEERLGIKVILDPALNRRPGTDGDEEDFKPKAPGMKYKHYAPKAEMIIFEGEQENVEKAIEEEKTAHEMLGDNVVVIMFDEGDSITAAKELFARLRDADREHADLILAGAVPEQGLGFSVMNRMLKSAGFNIRKV